MGRVAALATDGLSEHVLRATLCMGEAVINQLIAHKSRHLPRVVKILALVRLALTPLSASHADLGNFTPIAFSQLQTARVLVCTALDRLAG